MKPLAVAFLIAALALMGSSVSAQSPVRGGTLTIGLVTEPDNLDPAIALSSPSMEVFEHVYETLTVVDEKGNYAPSLATSWDNVNDTTWIFNIRKGVKFHNGEEVTANDVKYSFDRIKKVGSQYVAKRWDMVDEIRVLDRYTVEFKLKYPSGAFMSYLSSNRADGAAIVPRSVGEKEGDFSKVAVGTGPFQLKEYRPNSHATFVKNNSYWNSKIPYLDTMVYRYLPNPSSLLPALRSKQVDLILPDFQQAVVLQRDQSVVVKEFAGEWHESLNLNSRVKPFDQLKVRQAIMAAIDRNAMVQAVLGGKGQPTAGLPPSHPWSVPTSELAYYRQDLKKAQELLRDGGYANGFDMTMIVPSSYPQSVRCGEVIQNQLAKIGIRVTLQNIEYAVLLQKISTADYQAGTWPFRGYPDAEFYLSPRLERTGTWPDNHLMELFDQGRKTTSPEKRKAIYQEIQKVEAEIGWPSVWLTARNEFVVHQPYVKNFEPTSDLSFKGTWKTWIEK